MLTLSKKLKQASAGDHNVASSSVKKSPNQRASVRDRLLVGEVAELEKNLNSTCSVKFPEPDVLHRFYVTIRPDEGLWEHGAFEFVVQVPEDYNIAPPSVKCRTKIWHPNISETGDVCLSLLRDHSLDGTGWLPTRTLKDVVWGLTSLFTDLCDFDDPLNVVAAEQYHQDVNGFKRKVIWFIQRYALD